MKYLSDQLNLENTLGVETEVEFSKVYNNQNFLEMLVTYC